jgi:predicted component of type VI protein secretion system
VILTLESSSYSFSLDEAAGVASVGREQGSRVHIPEAGISGKHAELRCENGEWFVEDLHSRYGTAVNGRAIHEKTKLGNGDIVKFADMSFVITLAESNTLEAVGAGMAGGHLKSLVKTATTRVPKPAPANEKAIAPPEGGASDSTAMSSEDAAPTDEDKRLAAAGAAVKTARARGATTKDPWARGGRVRNRLIVVATVIILGCLGYLAWVVWKDHRAELPDWLGGPTIAQPQADTPSGGRVSLPGRENEKAVQSTAPPTLAPAAPDTKPASAP